MCLGLWTLICVAVVLCQVADWFRLIRDIVGDFSPEACPMQSAFHAQYSSVLRVKVNTVGDVSSHWFLF